MGETFADQIAELRKAIQAAKPNDRSDLDRVYAILITDLEKVQALAQMHEI